jgi:hypothetical protein
VASPIINGTFMWYILLTSDTVAIYTEWGHLFPKKINKNYYYYFSVVRSDELVGYRLQRNEESVYFFYFFIFLLGGQPKFWVQFPSYETTAEFSEAFPPSFIVVTVDGDGPLEGRPTPALM